MPKINWFPGHMKKTKELVQNNEEISIEKYYSTLEEIGDYKSNYKLRKYSHSPPPHSSQHLLQD